MGALRVRVAGRARGLARRALHYKQCIRNSLHYVACQAGLLLPGHRQHETLPPQPLTQQQQQQQQRHEAAAIKLQAVQRGKSSRGTQSPAAQRPPRGAAAAVRPQPQQLPQQLPQPPEEQTQFLNSAATKLQAVQRGKSSRAMSPHGRPSRLSRTSTPAPWTPTTAPELPTTGATLPAATTASAPAATTSSAAATPAPVSKHEDGGWLSFMKAGAPSVAEAPPAPATPAPATPAPPQQQQQSDAAGRPLSPSKSGRKLVKKSRPFWEIQEERRSKGQLARASGDDGGRGDAEGAAADRPLSPSLLSA